MCDSIKRAIVTLSSSSLMLLAMLPAIASQPINPGQLNSQAVGLSQQWRDSRGTIMVDGSLTRRDIRSQHSGSISALFRLTDDTDQIPFAQLGLNHYPNGQILHAGLGHRWWNGAESWWGVNLFYDHQLKEHHQRLSVGTEMQHDCLKLAVNGYLPLSGRRVLKNSLTDAIRPAQGCDAHVEAYVPQCPWLGFRSVGSYYAGTSGVILESQEFKEWHYPTVTLGLNVVPFPLVKISYDYTLGKQQMKAHRVTLQLTYRFNRSLKEQLQSDQVRQLRSCQGSQLDLVSRHYQLVFRRYQLSNKTTPHQIELNTTPPITRETPKNITEREQKQNRYRDFVSHLREKNIVTPDTLQAIEKEVIQPIFNRQEFDPAVFEEISESCGVLNEWIQFKQDYPGFSGD